MDDFYNRREHLENALWKWLAEVDKVKNDITELMEHNNVSKSQISKDIDKMKNKLVTVQNNLKRY